MLLPDHSGGIAEVFMKKFLVAALSCAAGMLAAQSIWEGSVQSISVSSGVKEPKVLAADGGVTVTGKTTGTGRYSYLTFYVKTKPFTLNGKDLVLGENWELPDLSGAPVAAGKVELAPLTCTFLVV